MKKKLIAILMAAALIFTFATCGDDNNSDDKPGTSTGNGWTHDIGNLTLTLSDNFLYGAGYQAKYNHADLFKGNQVKKGDKYILQITFTVSRDLEGLLFAGLVDENPNGLNAYWTELAYPVGGPVPEGIKFTAAMILEDDEADVASGVQYAGVDATTLIKAGEVINAELKWTAQRDSSGVQVDYNTLYFQTRGVGTTGTANSGEKGSAVISFTKFIFIKEDTEEGSEDKCECPAGTTHYEDQPACCSANNCACAVALRPATSYKITSPYEGVDWDNWEQYKAALHVHTQSSDGSNKITDMVDTYYANNYGILAITDHNYQGQSHTTVWYDNRNTARGDVPMTMQRFTEVTTGVGRTPPKGLLPIPNTSEIAAYPDEINTYWWDGAPGSSTTQIAVLEAVEAAGGIASINHPGRATGGATPTLPGYHSSMDKGQINRYAGYFLNYDCLTIMEIINRQDGDSYHDRVLWDNVLKVTVPQGKNVFGRADDDSHSNSAGNIGQGANMFILPENTLDEVKKAMLNGNFYAVARNAKLEGVNLGNAVGAGDYPAINKIVITGDDSIDATITMTVQHANKVDFITERQGPLGYYNVVHSVTRPAGTDATAAWDATIVLKDAKNARNEIVGCFVRVNVIGAGGIAFSQPFMIERTLDMSGN